MNCEYLISTTDEKQVVYVTFEFFDLESQSTCNYDSLTVLFSFEFLSLYSIFFFFF